MTNQTFGWTLAAFLWSPFVLIAILFIAYKIDTIYRRFTGKWLIVKDSYPGDTINVSKISSPYKYHTFAEVLSQPKLNDNQRRELLQQQIKEKGLDKTLYDNTDTTDVSKNTPIGPIITTKNDTIVDLGHNRYTPTTKYQSPIKQKAIAYQKEDLAHSNQVNNISNSKSAVVADSSVVILGVDDAVKRLKAFPKEMRLEILRRLLQNQSAYQINKEVFNLIKGRRYTENKQLFEAIRPLLKKGRL